MTAPPGYVQRQKRMVRLYRVRALEALHHARLARGAADWESMRSSLIAVRFWRQAASAWARKGIWS